MHWAPVYMWKVSNCFLLFWFSVLMLNESLTITWRQLIKITGGQSVISSLQGNARSAFFDLDKCRSCCENDPDIPDWCCACELFLRTLPMPLSYLHLMPEPLQCSKEVSHGVTINDKVTDCITNSGGIVWNQYNSSESSMLIQSLFVNGVF